MRTAGKDLCGVPWRLWVQTAASGRQSFSEFYWRKGRERREEKRKRERGKRIERDRQKAACREGQKA